MRRLRLLRLLLCVALWARLCDGVTKDTCTCKDVEKLKGLYTDRPCNECASGHYRTCDRGSYYAHHPTMCIYASRQEYTHDDAREMCVNRDLTGFLAFVGGLEESYDVSHYVWNALKNGVEGNETFFWVGGKYKRYERTGETFWFYKYRGYYDEVPRELLPDNATLQQAVREGRTCLAGHTENYTKLYPMRCDEKLPAVCYNYRQTSKHNCEQVDDKVWTLFRGKCYYVYSSPTNDRSVGYKTYFDAQIECKKMGAILATVTDEATFKRTLDLATGAKKILGIDDGTWIGLQLSGRGYGGIYYNITDGTKRTFKKFRNPPPKVTTPPPRVPPGETEGWWEDGTPYDDTDVVLKRFWTRMDSGWDQPNEEPLPRPKVPGPYLQIGKCSDYPKKIPQRGYNRERCKEDKFQHCTQIFPGSTENITDCPPCKPYGYKWNDRWCFFLPSRLHLSARRGQRERPISPERRALAPCTARLALQIDVG